MKHKTSLLAALAASTLMTAPAFACTTVSIDIFDCGGSVGILTTGPNGTLGVAGSIVSQDSTDGVATNVYGSSAGGVVDAIQNGNASVKKPLNLNVAGGGVNFGNGGYSNTINGATKVAANLGVGAIAPSLSSITWGVGTVTTDTGRALYGVGGSPALADSGGVAEFSNDASVSMKDMVGLPMWGTVNSIVHNTSGSPGPNNNIAAFNAFGDNEGAASDTGYGGSGVNEMVGYYANINCKVTGSQCWGANPLVINAAGTNTTGAQNANLIGSEIDVVNNETKSAGSGVLIVGASTQSGTVYDALDIDQMDHGQAGTLGLTAGTGGYIKGVNTVRWSHAVYIQPGSSSVAVEIGEDQSETASRGSMPLNFDWTDSLGTGHSLALAATNGGNLSVNGVAALSTTVTVPGTGCSMTFVSGLLTAKSGC